MSLPNVSKHYIQRKPSSIREAQIAFGRRKDKESIKVINLAIGNISMPMYPAMQSRLNELGNSIFSDGIIKYTPTVGTKDANKAFLNILESEGVNSKSIYSMVTDGGSSAMELMLLGVCGPSSKKPLLILDPAYTNYIEFSKRLSIPIVPYVRSIKKNGQFSGINYNDVDRLIKKYNPSGILIIPYDNPTGQFLNQDNINSIASLAVKHNIWIISDEAYRSLHYNSDRSSSIWRLSNNEIPNIQGRRISIESSSKTWNACGLRIGALLTDNLTFHKKSVSEYTANLCANSIGQEIFGVLATEPHEKLQLWLNELREYYKSILNELKTEFETKIPGIIVTKPEASIYFIIDLKNLVDNQFDAENFVNFCATKGKVPINNNLYTLLLAPMNGFYQNSIHGRTQLRVAMVESRKSIMLAPKILSKLINSYQRK